MPTKHTTKIAAKSAHHKKTNGHHVHHETRKSHRASHAKINGLSLKSSKDAKKALGALAAGLAGMASFFMLKAKKSKKSKSHFYNSYADLKDNASDLAHDAYDRSRKVYDYAADYAENVKDTAYDIIDQPYSGSLVLAGAIGGTILGATAVYLMTAKSSRNSSGLLDKAIHVFDVVKDSAEAAKENLQSHNWLDAAKDVLAQVSDKVHEFQDEGRGHSKNHSHLNDAFNLALNGYHLFQNMSKKKR